MKTRRLSARSGAAGTSASPATAAAPATATTAATAAAQATARRKPGQLGLTFRTWGGKRKGAGRKPNGERDGVPHRPRPDFARRLPAHVTLRMAAHVYNLRSRRSFRLIQKALREGGADRFGVQVIRFSVQGNHIHLLVEAEGRLALARAVKGLSVRLARKLNALMNRRGQVLGDRYHARLLRTPTEVKRAVLYIRDNACRHASAWGDRLPAGWVDPYSSESPTTRVVLPAPRTWLLRAGWLRAP